MQNHSPTFIRLFANEQRGTEYLAISTITRAHVEINELDKGATETRVHIFTLEGAQRTVTGSDAQEIIETLDKLSPGASSSAPAALEANR
jgi:hypothetical protein